MKAEAVQPANDEVLSVNFESTRPKIVTERQEIVQAACPHAAFLGYFNRLLAPAGSIFPLLQTAPVGYGNNPGYSI